MGSVNYNDETRSVISDVGDIGNVDFANDGSFYNYNPENEGPVVISVPFPLADGKPQFVPVGETVFNAITIQNTSTEAATLWSVEIYDSKPDKCFTLSVMEPPSPNSDEDTVKSFVDSFSLEDRTLLPGKTLTIYLLCKPTARGLHTTALHFNVEEDKIERMGFIMAEDKISQSLTSKKPYNRVNRNKPMLPRIYSPGGNNPGVRVMRGHRPAKANSRPYRYKLPEYPIPKDIRDVIESKGVPDALMEGLTKRNYVPFFRTLINMEEIKLEEDVRTYDMQGVVFKRKYRLLTLEVPGLAEKRPSLVVGDSIIAKPTFQNEHNISPLYTGDIIRVEAEEIHLQFHEDLHSYYSEGDHFDVQFQFNRLGMRRLYQAIEATGKLDTEFLFPDLSSTERYIETSPLVPISCNLNEEQLSSVEMILGCKGGPPYVVHGPPGTGKSVTLTEAILQLYRTRRNSKILVCAPSNYAADHLLDKLVMETAVTIGNGDLLRLNALSRSVKDIKQEYLEFCSYEEEESGFICPMFEKLARYRIIISTYSTAAMLYAEGLQTGHFTHIFLDEAAQASEPETSIPVSHFYRRDTVVVLAGDPVQLGPVIFSKEAENSGLGVSFMERLCDSKFYKDGNQNYVTKLVRNYRCHEHILSLPSELFYKGDLVSCKEDDTLYPLTWKDYLPNPEFPVLFIGVQGVDEREGNNPSWFNRIEISEVVEVVMNLRERGIESQDIGVITPYRQQVSKINRALEEFVGLDIKVGTVESFQGQEREVIIVSTVRSTIKHNDTDKRHCLGFLSNPRRFNVAITRARSLLLVIGNPHIICKDEHWNRLLWHCADNDSYKGCFLPEKEEIVSMGSETEQYGSSNCQGNWNNGDPSSFSGGNASENGNWDAGSCDWNANQNGNIIPPAPGGDDDWGVGQTSSDNMGNASENGNWDVGTCDWNANQNGNFIPSAPGGDDDCGVGPTASYNMGDSASYNMGDSTIQTPSGPADCKDASTDIPTENSNWSEYPPVEPTGASDHLGDASSDIYTGTSDNWGEG